MLLGTATLALVLLGLVALNGVLLALAIPLVVFWGAALWYAPAEVRLRAERTLSTDRVGTGSPVVVCVTITNEGQHLEELLVEDICPPALDVIDGHVVALTSLAPGESVKLEYRISGRRGFYHFSQIQATASDYLGLFRRQVLLAAPARLMVLPEVVRLTRADIRPRRTRVYSGMIPARQGGPGVEFFGVREYQAGDPVRWINGRVSARFPSTLYVNEFEQERVADVGVILDARLRSDVRVGATALFEQGVHAAAAIASALLDRGNRVGLLIYGNTIDWTFPGYGKHQRERVLWALARAEQGDRAPLQTLDEIPTRLFPSRSQIILISPLLPDDVRMIIRLRARDYQVLVISPDPIDFERSGIADSQAADLSARLARLERDLLLRRLREAGVHVVDWRIDEPFHQVAATALARRGMV